MRPLPIPQTILFRWAVRLSIVLSIWLVTCREVPAEIIPSERLMEWKPGITVGVPGGIPTDRTHLIDVTQPPYNADNTGANDAQPAIEAAIKAAQSGDVVYLPAGTYRADSVIGIGAKRNITLRGEGKSTIIDSHAGRGISVGSESDYLWQNPNLDITGDPCKGDSVLSVGDTSSLKDYPHGGIGHICQISVTNDPDLPVLSVGEYDRLRKQKSRIVAKTDTTVTIFPPLHFDLPSQLAPKLSVASYQAEFVGIEDLKIDCTNGKTQFTIWMPQCYGCWLQNVTSLKTNNYHVAVYDSVQCEIRHCDMRERQGTGSNGAGILFGASCSCLVEDNIIYFVFPHIEVNGGSSGNVFAYNICERNDVFGIMGVSIDSNHGPHNSFNLYEGNIASKFQSDGYFGSESECTAFRNWFHGTSDETDQFGICMNINRFSRNFTAVGNLLGRSGHTYLYDNDARGFGYDQRFIYVLGMPNMGNGSFTGTVQPSRGVFWSDWGKSPGANGFQEYDQDVAATTIRRGNWNAIENGIPASEAIETEPLPDSLFRSSKPDWFGNLTWPPFDPRRPNQSYEAIPAGYRYLHNADPRTDDR